MKRLAFLILLLLIYSTLAVSAQPEVAESAESAALSAIYTVNSSVDVDDSSCNAAHCSLREAINAANSGPNIDTIHFDFNSPQIITLATPLPTITAPLVIDGTASNSATCPSGAETPASLFITIDGANLPDIPLTNGIELEDAADFSQVSGLRLIGFSGNAIEVHGINAIIRCNEIGLNEAGASPNRIGINVFAPEVTIGGTQKADRNVISGNSTDGIFLNFNADEAKVYNNFIGLAADGVTPLGNGDDGINLFSTNDDSVIGNAHPNRIAHNAGAGVVFNSGGQPNHGGNAVIRFNNIYANGGLGIDLALGGNEIGQVQINDTLDADVGPNGLQNYPVLSSAESNGRIYANMPVKNSTTYDVDFYQNNSCDESGYGEGETYLNSVSISSATGVAFIDVVISPAPAIGTFVSAIATDPDGNSSEFSNCIPVTEKTFVVNELIGNDDDTGDGICDVDTATSDEECSLRAAIEQVNALSGGPYRVNFDLDDTSLFLVSPLPTISTPIIIDGSTNPGATCPTKDNSGGARIELNGFSMTTGDHIMTLGVGSSGSEIRGLYIRNAPSDGLRINSDNNVIACNTFSWNSDDGVHVTGDNNRVGAISTYADRNVFFHNAGSGVQLSNGATSNKVRGNYIGTDGNGLGAGANGTGIALTQDVSDTTIGGTIPLRRNIIAGNSSHGIFIERTSASNTIIGNYIGVDVTGSAELPNGGAGVRIENSAANIIGGPEDGESNVISANEGHGVYLIAANDTAIYRNLIGTDRSGLLDFGNTLAGIRNEESESITIGALDPAYGNVISGNDQSGIVLINGTNLNKIFSNKIGVSVNGSPLGNGLHGIHLDATTVSATLYGNTISHNGRDGVRVDPQSIFNSITVNSISDNGWLGIDLGEDGVTENDDAPDGDGGANDLQNYPVIVSADSATNQVTLSLESVRNVDNMRIDLYRSRSCDDSGHGQGEEWLDLLVVNTDADGLANITATVSGFAGGDYLTATATNPDSNFSTSEFSLCYQIASPTAVGLRQQANGQQSTGFALALAVLTLLSLRTGCALFHSRTHPVRQP